MPEPQLIEEHNYVEVENVEVRIVDEINSVIEWFDYLEKS